MPSPFWPIGSANCRRIWPPPHLLQHPLRRPLRHRGEPRAAPPLKGEPASPPSGGSRRGWSSWGNTGIQIVDLDRIDLSDSSVAETGDFHKVSAQEMQEGLRKLQDVVMPAVAQGADGDYFSRLDAAQGLDYAHGYRRIYDAFYGQNCICLDQVGDRYQVVNGYHRLFLTRQMGIQALAARVRAPRS